MGLDGQNPVITARFVSMSSLFEAMDYGAISLLEISFVSLLIMDLMPLHNTSTLVNVLFTLSLGERSL